MAEYVAPEFKPENEKISIWRYLTFDKYVSMLQNQGLFFVRPYLFNDPQEGVPPSEYLSNQRKFIANAFHEKGDAKIRRAHSRAEKHGVNFARKVLMVNCWHMSKHESIAMWNIYAGRDSGLALVSSCQLLKRHIVDINVRLGVIRYTDTPHSHDIYHRHSFAKLLFKRPAFKSEEEFRALKGDPDPSWWNPRVDDGLPNPIPPDNGQWVQANLAKIISKVVVSPYADSSFVATIADVTKKYGFDWKVRRSRLLDSPKWVK